jgi:nicotinate-nucleotide adenylyltransferase
MVTARSDRAPRIGVFGGTFDPVHVGHLVAAVNARAALDLDRVLLVVANTPWQKVGDRSISPAEDRLAMVQAAAMSSDGVEASSMEIARGGPSYTADTLADLGRVSPGAELFVIVGADVVGGLDTWERIDEVRERSTLVVVNRPGSDASGYFKGLRARGWRIEAIEVPALEISSTDLRERAATGRPLDYLVPDGAIRVIRDRALYAANR